MIARVKYWIGGILDRWAQSLRRQLHEELVPQRNLGVVFGSGRVVYPKVTRREAARGVKSVTVRNLMCDRIVAVIQDGVYIENAPGLPFIPNGGDVIIVRDPCKSRAAA
ncbi:MAG: hypothetical protein E6Q97_26020 [Desulfurellales bacterium]|nr:MAG: hypothetical protein E6Q97_26020 [Desulfurellales bacterium]